MQGVRFVAARGHVGLQLLVGLAEVDTLSGPLRHLGSQLIALLAQPLQSLISEEQLENIATTTSTNVTLRNAEKQQHATLMKFQADHIAEFVCCASPLQFIRL